MSYRCGIGPGLDRLGLEPGPPRVICDGCGATWVLRTDRAPPTWFLDGKAPPRWKRQDADGKRQDYCPKCKEGGAEVTR